MEHCAWFAGRVQQRNRWLAVRGVDRYSSGIPCNAYKHLLAAQFQPSFFRPLFRFSAGVSESLRLVIRILIARRVSNASLSVLSRAMAALL